MEFLSKVRILELNGRNLHILVSARPIRRMPLKDTAYPAPEGHLDTLKTYTAYDPIIYAVS